MMDMLAPIVIVPKSPCLTKGGRKPLHKRPEAPPSVLEMLLPSILSSGLNTAAICTLTGNQPGNVCTDPTITVLGPTGPQ